MAGALTSGMIAPTPERTWRRTLRGVTAPIETARDRGQFGEDELTRVDVASYDRQLARLRGQPALPPVGAYLVGHGVRYRVAGYASSTSLRCAGESASVEVILDWGAEEAQGWRVVCASRPASTIRGRSRGEVR